MVILLLIMLSSSFKVGFQRRSVSLCIPHLIAIWSLQQEEHLSWSPGLNSWFITAEWKFSCAHPLFALVLAELINCLMGQFSCLKSSFLLVGWICSGKDCTRLGAGLRWGREARSMSKGKQKLSLGAIRSAQSHLVKLKFSKLLSFNF